MISDARGGHVSPGIYTEERDVAYSVKSLGITSLGLVGETLYGPAFENVEIENWGEFVDYFGGTSPEKFKGTGLPKYELPYIAKSYLEESKRLNVVRVLGLSGYHAGTAFVCSESAETAPVVILRGKMVYGYSSGDICAEVDPDMPVNVVSSVTVSEYEQINYDANCVPASASTASTKPVDKFCINVVTNGVAGFESGATYKYNVSLNPADNDYIYKVLGSKPNEGNAPIYIEAVYEHSWNGSAITVCTPVVGENVKTTEYYELVSGNTFELAKSIDESKSYVNVSPNNVSAITESGIVTDFIVVNDSYVTETSATTIKVTYTTSAAVYDDFLEMYRPAQTPWIVSEASAEKTGVSIKKLFKFITISDGEAANYQVKVSLQNINPIEGTFDVLIRDFNDSDVAPVVLEKFSRCNLIEGDTNYIAFKIGTVDGGYAAKSKYVLVEMASDEDLSNHVPAGFLGFPMPSYTGLSSESNPRAPFRMEYNTLYDATKKPRKQYFGLNSEIIDSDILAYKGRYFYDNAGDGNPAAICNGFHMDAILNKYTSAVTFVDGVSGYVFTAVSDKKVGSETAIPRLINAGYIMNTIYKDVNTRKFTTYFYGGFDGWDANRTSRTNTDAYKASRYNVKDSYVFDYVTENGLNESLNLPSTAITTDYYAYLAGYRRFANPQDVDINLFATPGIDWYNNTLLTEDAIDMIEDPEDGRGGDALYIMASPKDLDVEDTVLEFSDLEIDTSYAATYYPWVMYYDSSNKRYLDLPVTKDVVRNMAATDNNAYPWFAPAGTQRGSVNCVKALHKTTLTDEDLLYEGRINPVKSFAQDGVKIWGNKTAYSIESPLNRINVRRLMIRIKKLVTEASKSLIFEQYDDTLEKQFRGLVEPILADVKSNRGLYDYRVITEVTEETRDQHILPAKILVKPTPALEYISISFVVYPESVSFEEN